LVCMRSIILLFCVLALISSTYARKKSNPTHHHTRSLRLASSFSTSPSQSLFGVLTDLIGTWVGNKGWNLIAVPNQQGKFVLEVVPYSEIMVISSLNTPTPNRGTSIIQEVPTLTYTLSIHNSIDQSLLHHECGTWLLLPNCPSGFQLARQATVPHGTSVIALGNYSIIQGPPTFPVLSSLPVIPGTPATSGYFNQYDPTSAPTVPINKTNLIEVLEDAICEQKIISTTQLSFSTDNEGVIGSIPFVTQNANAVHFEGNFWIETVEDAQGNTYLQLQYVQRTLLAFIKQFADPNELIQWPHVNVNTMVKQ